MGRRNASRWIVVATMAVAVVAGALAWWNVAPTRESQTARKGGNAIAVVTARVEKRDVPVRLRSNGTVTAVQSVDIRAQVTSTVRTVHIREGQAVRSGELLFSLDARAEHEVFQRFADLTRGKSAILISHRFSTVRMADRVLVLDNGEILEIGTHEELLARAGRYSELFNLQAMGYR